MQHHSQVSSPCRSPLSCNVLVRTVGFGAYKNGVLPNLTSLGLDRVDDAPTLRHAEDVKDDVYKGVSYHVRDRLITVQFTAEDEGLGDR